MRKSFVFSPFQQWEIHTQNQNIDLANLCICMKIIPFIKLNFPSEQTYLGDEYV